MTSNGRRQSLQASTGGRSVLGAGLAVSHATLLALPLAFAPIFSTDWVNHAWFANYVAHHLQASWSLPTFANVADGLGNPVLLFYGLGLYASLAPIIELFGPELGMRVAVFLALLLPNLVLVRVLYRCVQDAMVAGCVTIILSTSVYQLTNIYSRAAVTEFFAYQLLLLALVLLIDASLDKDGLNRLLKATLGVTSGALGLLSHPPSLYLAFVLLGVPSLLFAATQRINGLLRERDSWLLLLASMVATVPLVTWIALAWAYSSKLKMSTGDAPGNLIYFPWSIDHWLARFLPWPVDFRVAVLGVDLVSTPNLNAPINLAALLLLLYLLLVTSKRSYGHSLLRSTTGVAFLSSICVVIFISLVASLPFGELQPDAAVDVSPISRMAHAPSSSWRGSVFWRIQFAYRLVSFTNLSIVFGCLGIVLASKHRDSPRTALSFLVSENSRTLLVVLTTMATFVACMKVVEVYQEFRLVPALSERLFPDEDGKPTVGGMKAWVSSGNVHRMRLAMRHTTRAPATQYGISAYSMPSMLTPYEDSELVSQTVRLRSAGASRAFAVASCERPCALMTDLLASPFFALSLDGVALPISALRTRDGFVVVPAGEGEHQLDITLGTRATRLLARSTLVLILLFWSVSVVLAIRALAITPRP